MQDLLLWRLLPTAEASPELGTLLGELADLPLGDRLPYLGLAIRMLDAADSSCRTAAVRCLAGAQGAPAWQALVRALDDSSPEVREAASAALYESARRDPGRWVHAVFHPDPQVRLDAIRRADGAAADWMHLFLLADPACRELVFQRLPSTVLDARAWGVVLRFARDGSLPPSEARRLIAQLDAESLLRRLDAGTARSQPELARILIASRTAPTATEIAEATYDAYDEIFDLFWEDSPAPDDARRIADFFGSLSRALLRPTRTDRRRPAAALLVNFLRRPAACLPAAELCCILRSDAFASPWLPAEVRRQAAGALYRLGSECPKQPDEQVRLLLEQAPVRRASGHLDLWFIGALLHFIDKNPYAKLQQWFSVGSISAAFWDDPVDSAPFFCHYDGSEQGRKFLIEAVAAVRRPKIAYLLARLALVLTADAGDLFGGLDPNEAAAVFDELRTALAEPGVAPTEQGRVRLADALARRIAPTATAKFLRKRLAHDERPDELENELFASLARAGAPEDFVSQALLLKPEQLLRLVDRIGSCANFPYAVRTRLEAALDEHADPKIRARAARPASEVERPAKKIVRDPAEYEAPALSAVDEARLAGCADSFLDAEIAAVVTKPVRGLCRALGARVPPPSPSVAVCAALLVSHDEPAETAREFERFGSDRPAFLHALDVELVARWQADATLGTLGHCRLSCWEFHNFALADRLGNDPERWQQLLGEAAAMPSPTLALSVWQAVERIAALWRYRNPARLLQIAVGPFVELLVRAIDGPLGPTAARTLAVLHGSKRVPEILAAWRSEAIVRLPRAAPATATALRSWINAQGVAALPVAASLERRRSAEEDRRRIAACRDVDELEQLCRGADVGMADEAALRLIELGGDALVRLANVLETIPEPLAAPLLAESVAFWPAGEGVDRIRAMAASDGPSPRLQFALTVALAERGEPDWLRRSVEAACRTAAESWFQPVHWRQLTRLGWGEDDLARALAASPQPNAYVPAVTRLIGREALEPDDRRALAAFLESDSQRMAELRLQVARRLREVGDRCGFPLLLAEAMAAETDPPIPDLLAVEATEHAAAVDAFLAAGNKCAAEGVLLRLLEHPGVDDDLRDATYRRLLLETETDAARTKVAAAVRHSPMRFRKLRRTAEEFAWGVRMGRELTGRLFSVEMIAGDSLGYTRFSADRIYVNPLALLRGEQNGADVLRGLVVHEIGHHVYHRGSEAEKVWNKAAVERLHSLLNLVADEHLERNLRARGPIFGDPLKRLAAYAFRHSQREVSAEYLLECLQERAFAVLSSMRPGVARRPGRIVVNNGSLLRALEGAGSPFARFVRALRMGLGRRDADPLVERALALFSGPFRRSNMQELYDCAVRLREMFGSEVAMLDIVCQQNTMQADGFEITGHGEGIDNDSLQQEVRRILEAPRGGGGSGSGGVPCVNVGPDEAFPIITRVEKVAYDPAASARYAALVARPARELRKSLEQLGVAPVPQRMRLRGKALDRTRLRALVLRGDPRMLIGRELAARADLFLGVVVDCSGSMQAGESMEKARRFATLLAEACRGPAGIDLRVFGFTDSVIYDAGDADRCAAHGLQAGGGNNDAAGLQHAALEAKRSRRRTRLLVMISDGLPTECSTTALKALVVRLSRRERICCAQVAVRPLEEVCFPHYVLLDGENLSAAVRRFAETVLGLVRRTMNV